MIVRRAGRPCVGPHRTSRATSAVLLICGVVGCGAPAPPPTATASPIVAASPAAPTATVRETLPTGEPPGAVLSVAETGPHLGRLGTFDYRGGGSDAPWLPARVLDDIDVARGAPLVIRLDHGTEIGSWNAVVAAAADAQGVVTQGLAEDTNPGPKREIRMTAPRSGSWVLAVTVRFADGSGSAVYFWQIDVR